MKFSIVFSLGNIINGYGDEVCYILNDLTTEILIRRNYEFKLPVPLRDSAQEGVAVRLDTPDDDIVEELDHDFLGDSQAPDSDSRANLKYLDEALVNPLDWYKECEQVKDELLELEQGRMEDWYRGPRDRHAVNLLEMRRRSQEVGAVVALLQRSQCAEVACGVQEELSRILDKEKELNALHGEYLASLKAQQDSNRFFDEEILRLTTGNKKKIEEYSELKAKHRDLSDKLKRKQTEATDNRRLLDLKDAIKTIKVGPSDPRKRSSRWPSRSAS